jgi:Protein of unknown function (DUF1573)
VDEMKAILCTLIIASLCGVGGAQDSRPEPWGNHLFGYPADRFHQFGMVQPGQKLQHEFEITNIYRVPVEIRTISTSTHAARGNVEKKVLQPGEKTKLVVTVDTERFSGSKTGNLYVMIDKQGDWPRHPCEVILTWFAVKK